MIRKGDRVTMGDGSICIVVARGLSEATAHRRCAKPSGRVLGLRFSQLPGDSRYTVLQPTDRLTGLPRQPEGLDGASAGAERLPRRSPVEGRL